MSTAIKRSLWPRPEPASGCLATREARPLLGHCWSHHEMGSGSEGVRSHRGPGLGGLMVVVGLERSLVVA